MNPIKLHIINYGIIEVTEKMTATKFSFFDYGLWKNKTNILKFT